MKIRLSDHFSVRRMLRFTAPSIVMMIFTSIYGVVDGLFVSNFAGEAQFAAINLIMPYLMLFGTVGFMVGTGGTALVSKTLGEGDREKANRLFSMLIYLSAAAGVALSGIGLLLLRPVAVFLGAEGTILEYCLTYGRLILPGCAAFILQNVFQSFCITAEKPRLGLLFTVAAGCTNMVLDGLFVGVFGWELAGAAVATVISQVIGGFAPLLYFLFPNKSLLRLGKAVLDGKAILTTCTNGSSELMSNVSMSFVGMLYNYQLMRYVGEHGVAAYGVIMYVTFIFLSVFLGFSIGIAPVVGFHFGAKDREELHGLLKKSLLIVGTISVGLFFLSELLAEPLAAAFVGYEDELEALTVRGFRIFSISFLLCGFSVFGSAFFTALNNGPVSAAISFLRVLVFQTTAVLLLPPLLGENGIWYSETIADAAALIVTASFLLAKRKKYGY